MKSLDKRTRTYRYSYVYALQQRLYQLVEEQAHSGEVPLPWRPSVASPDTIAPRDYRAQFDMPSVLVKCQDEHIYSATSKFYGPTRAFAQILTCGMSLNPASVSTHPADVHDHMSMDLCNSSLGTMLPCRRDKSVSV
jgi:hypothetical protein